MSSSAAAHIPVLPLPAIRPFADPDDALVDVLDYRCEGPSEPSEADLRDVEYQRGLAEGEEKARAHFQALLDRERDQHAKALEEEKIRFEMREAANIGAAIEGCMNVMEQRLSYSLARLLQPYLKEKVIEQLVAAFADNLKILARDPNATVIRLRGPQTLIGRVLEQVPGIEGRIETEIADQVELEAFLQETTLETRLGQWLSKIDELQSEGI